MTTLSIIIQIMKPATQYFYSECLEFLYWARVQWNRNDLPLRNLNGLLVWIRQFVDSMRIHRCPNRRLLYTIRWHCCQHLDRSHLWFPLDSRAVHFPAHQMNRLARQMMADCHLYQLPAREKKMIEFNEYPSIYANWSLLIRKDEQF